MMSESNVQNSNPTAIVVGMDDIRGVHAARTLAAYDVPVVGIARSSRSYGCRTKACRQIHIADTRTEEFIALLEGIASSFAEPPVIVPCTDMAVLQLSRYRRRLQPAYRMTLPEPHAVETLVDKVQFYRFAQECGFPIPKTCLLSSRNDIEVAAAALSFPMAVKPPNSKAPVWQKRTRIKAFKVESLHELREVFDTYHRLADPLIAQQWIEGPETELYACYAYFDADSRPLATFTSRKLRQWPAQTGQGCLADEVRNDRVRQITIDLLQAVGFRGLGYVEIKRESATGNYFIVEPNIGRVSGRMAIAEAGGVELLGTMYCDAIGRPLPENRTQTFIGAKWIYLRQDVQSALYYLRRGELSPWQWLKSLQGRKRYALLSWKDPGPFLGDLVNGLQRLVSRRERKKGTSCNVYESDTPLPAARR